jgi:ISXO2-like transposase domain
VAGSTGLAAGSGLPALRLYRQRRDQAGRQEAPSGRLSVQRLPRAIHGHGQDGFRAFQNPVVEMACCAFLAYRFKERRLSASSPSLTWHLVQVGLVMMHRLREATRTGGLAPLGGAGKTVEIDETAQGKIQGAPKRAHRGMGSYGRTVLTLVERGGSARSFHVEGTTLGALLPIIRANVHRETAVMTDATSWYKLLPTYVDVASHDRVDHTNEEYVRYDGDRVISTNTVEGYYSIFKRGMKGVYQHCGEKHLHRYLAEFDFRYNTRTALGFNDLMRAEQLATGIKGKRLTYRRPHTVTQSSAL